MTPDNLKKATQDQEVLLACKVLLAAMAYEEVLSEKILPKQAEILRNLAFKSKEGEIIDSPKKSYLLSDNDFKIYWEIMNEYYDSLGLQRPTNDHCPLLMAQSRKREAERTLLQSMQKHTGLDIRNMFPKHRDAYLEITLKLISPFV